MASAEELITLTKQALQIHLPDGNPCVQVEVDAEDQARLEVGTALAGFIVVADRYQLHKLIIEIDRQLSRHARQL